MYKIILKRTLVKVYNKEGQRFVIYVKNVIQSRFKNIDLKKLKILNEKNYSTGP